MKAKARENLEAALRLLEHGLLNAAASRLYFAAFQAAAFALEKRGRAPPEGSAGARGWSHGKVEDRVASIRGQEEDRGMFGRLRLLREMADYGPTSVPRRELDFIRRDGERFVRDLTR